MSTRKRIVLSLVVMAIILIASAKVILSPGIAPVPVGQEPIRPTVADAAGVTAQVTVENGIFRDDAAGYALKIPDGWTIGNYPGLFLSPDAEGVVGYADAQGMALTVDRSAKDAADDLTAWLSQPEQARYLGRLLATLSVEDRPAQIYEANWDTQGRAVTAFVDDRDAVLRISCFHPADAPSQPCLDVLSQLLPTVRLDRAD